MRIRQITIHTTTLTSGLFLIAVGYLIYSGSLAYFNQYISSTSIQNIISKIEASL